MEKCSICNKQKGSLLELPYNSSEKVWLLSMNCCNESLCLNCFKKIQLNECPICKEKDILYTLPLSIARLTNYKP